MGKRLASETIFSGKTSIIPMADVAFIEKDGRPECAGCIRVVMHASKWSEATQAFEPSVWMESEDAAKFLRAWCYYRGEIDPVHSGPQASGKEG